MTDRAITDRAQLEAEIDLARGWGFAYNLGEREDDITAIVVPVLTGSGRMVAGLSLFGPTSRVTRETLDAARSRLPSAAYQASILQRPRGLTPLMSTRLSALQW